MKLTTAFFFLAILLLLGLFLPMVVVPPVVQAQRPYYFSNPPYRLVSYGLRYMPASTTDVWTSTTHIDSIFLHNTSGGAVTVTIADKSTDCNSGVCNLLTTTSIAAGQTWTMSMPGGIRLRSGVTVAASAANSIVVEIRGVQ